MQLTTLEKSTIEKGLIYLIIFGVVIVFAFIFYLLFASFSRSITLTDPSGGEKWEIGKSYKITWKSKGIQNVGIVLFKGKEAKWIKKNIPAVLGKFEWTIEPGQPYGDDYWIAVFEYPYRKDGKISYSDGSFVITYPEMATCDNLSVNSESVFVPGDSPNARKVFITSQKYDGNLGGFEGADKICQTEAKEQNLSGNYSAFLGGDSEGDVAVERIKRTAKKDSGVFIEAKAESSLIRGTGCHRLLGKNFAEFVKKFSNSATLNKEKLATSFYNDLKNVWLGRLDSQSKLNCSPIAEMINDPYVSMPEKYSYTSTCQNWTTGEKFADGYAKSADLKTREFPNCYSSSGQSTKAVVMGGLGIGMVGTAGSEAFTPYQGKYCKEPQKLICIEN